MRMSLFYIVALLVFSFQVMSDDMSYEDRQKLHQIERDISRLSSSTIGDPRDRQMQVESLMRQQELIYSKYGAQASPRVVIQNQQRRGYR
jgi:hypothetical protein